MELFQGNPRQQATDLLNFHINTTLMRVACLRVARDAAILRLLAEAEGSMSIL